MEKNDYRAETQSIRPCAEEKNGAILGVINDAAAAYKGVIPADRWHDPYLSMDELKDEIAAGVRFTGYSVDGRLVGVMGIQSVLNVRLIRHAYVLSIFQGRGIGSALMRHLLGSGTSPILIGTWAVASWAIGFYEGHGFTVVPQKAIAPLLKVYWDVPAQQIANSVVLATPALTIDGAARLVAGAFQP